MLKHFQFCKGYVTRSFSFYHTFTRPMGFRTKLVNEDSNYLYCKRCVKRALLPSFSLNKLSYDLFGFVRYNSTKTCLDDLKLVQYLKNINVEILHSKYKLRHSENETVYTLVKEKDKLEETLKQLDVMKLSEGNAKDNKELMDLIEEDVKQYTLELKEIYEKLVHCLLPESDFEDCNDIVLEISAGVGGLEAMLFANELLRMYCNFLDYKGWQYLLAEKDGSDLGGLRHCALLVSGRGAYCLLQHEAGVHRVQRIPATERGGRVHTSTVTVAILPQPSDVQVTLKDSDLKIETKRSSGAGGQHVNTTDSAVRIVHIPTGIAVECQTERSQIQNKANALKRLQAKIYEMECNQMDSSIRSQRKMQVGSSGRSEKIRTYNFRDDRISDHRLLANVHNLKEFMDGGEPLEKLLEQLEVWHYNSRIQRFIDSLPS